MAGSRPIKGPKDANFGMRQLLGLGLDMVIISISVKVLLFVSYRSTDFEVHRHWLAITHSLPMSRWYYDETSPWTLDYPPFFAYFEFFLSIFASIIDPAIVDLSNHNYEAWSCVVFQRTSVILSETVLLTAALKLVQESGHGASSPSSLALLVSLLLHPGLIIVDHIHFQYNGLLLGILLWSIWAIKKERYNLAAFLFASLLNFKHIFIYLSPPFIVYLFKMNCIDPDSQSFATRIKFSKLFDLALIVLITTSISFGPFVYFGGLDGLKQILSRLFPFQRGLNHAYWAANAWALYSTLDRVLVQYVTWRGARIDPKILNSTSRGLVGDTSFGVLPDITPKICFAITASLVSIVISRLWYKCDYDRFLKSIVISGLTSFLFGWHVHEKAVLLFLIPLTLISNQDYQYFKIWQIASVSGIFGLFPLLINPAETPFKIIFSLIWVGTVSTLLKKNLHRPDLSSFSIFAMLLEKLYLLGFALIQAYVLVIHKLLFSTMNRYLGRHTDVREQGIPVTSSSMEFLPLMMISVYCSLGMCWSYLKLMKKFLSS